MPVFMRISVNESLAAQPDTLLVLTYAVERRLVIRRLRLQLSEALLTFLFMHDPVVRKDPDASIHVLFYLMNGPVTQQGIVMVLEVVSVECI